MMNDYNDARYDDESSNSNDDESCDSNDTASSSLGKCSKADLKQMVLQQVEFMSKDELKQSVLESVEFMSEETLKSVVRLAKNCEVTQISNYGPYLQHLVTSFTDSAARGDRHLLGQGGQARVFRCTGLIDGRLYAVKETTIQDDDKDNFVKKVCSKLREPARHSMIPSNANVVTYYDVHLTAFGPKREITRPLMAVEEDKENIKNAFEFPFQISTPFKTETTIYSDECGYSVGSLSPRSLNTKNAKTYNAIISVHMEYCNGETLQRYIQDHGSKMQMEVKLNLIYNILLGVQHLHRCKVVHCDLRGDNIYIHVDAGTNRPLAKIGDFGNSRMEGVEEQNMHYDSD